MSSRVCLSGRGRPGGAALAGAVLTGWLCPAAADTVFSPHIGASIAWTDNINLLPPGQTSDGEIYQLLPGIYLKHDSQYLHATLDYEFQGYFYGGGQHGHDTYQTGNLSAEGTVVPDWFFLDLVGGQAQSVVDPTRNANINLLFPVGNIANESGATGTPVLRHKFTRVQVDASYSWGFVHNQPVGTVDETLPNTSSRTGNFKLSSVDQKALLTWDTLYQRQETTYTNIVFPRWLYELAQADLGLLTTSSLRLLAEGGDETNLQTSISQGGLNSPFWLAGFDWSPDPLNDLRLMAGRRFFGNSYQASLRHQSRLLNLQVNYSETPTTTANQFLPTSGTPNIVVIPGVPQFQRITADVFVLKMLDARAGLTGRLSELGVELTTSEQNYLTFDGVPTATPLADRMRTATLYVTRRLGAQLQAALNASVDHTDLREGGAETFDDRHYSARLTDLVGRHTSVTLSLDHYERTGFQVFKVNMITLNANMTFGNGPASTFPNPIAPAPAVPGALAAATLGAVPVAP